MTDATRRGLLIGIAYAVKDLVVAVAVVLAFAVFMTAFDYLIGDRPHDFEYVRWEKRSSFEKQSEALRDYEPPDGGDPQAR